MVGLKDKIDKIKVRRIKNEEEYTKYCQILEQLGGMRPTSEIEDLIDVLELVISDYNDRMFSVEDSDPISFLKELMEVHGMNQQDLSEVIGISKGGVSLIMNYRRGLSKEVIRKLSAHFSMRHEAFNRPYKLKVNEVTEESEIVSSLKEMDDTSYRLHA